MIHFSRPSDFARSFRIRSKNLRWASTILLFAIASWYHTPHLFAQVSSYGDETLPPIPSVGHDYIHLLNETVNPSNGSVSLNIAPPLAPTRGLSVPFSISYGSGAVNSVTADPLSATNNTGSFTSGGWVYALPTMSNSTFSTTGYIGAENERDCSYATNFLMTDAAGTPHDLALGVASNVYVTGGAGPQNEPCDSSYLNSGDDEVSATVAAQSGQNTANVLYVDVYDQSGTHYHFPGLPGGGPKQKSLPTYMEDHNGNIVNFFSNNSSFGYTDTGGRTAVSVNGGTTGTATVNVSGLSYAVSWRAESSNFAFPYQKSFVETEDALECPIFCAVG